MVSESRFSGGGHADGQDLKQPLLNGNDDATATIVASTAEESAELGTALAHRITRSDSQAPPPHERHCTVFQTICALLTLQLGWGLWLLPCDFARLGWIPGFVVLAILAGATAYSGSLFTRLYAAVPRAVLLGDIGEAAVGHKGRALVYGTIYSLDATRCIILHLAATQSIYHALAPSLETPLPLWQCSAVVAVAVLLLGQIRYLTQLSSFFLVGTAAQMVALAIVIHDLVLHRGPPAEDHGDGGSVSQPAWFLRSTPIQASEYAAPLVPEGNLSDYWVTAAMAILNMIFAYGGQFAFLELLTSMQTPQRFTHAVLGCTGIMTALYGSFGAVGYWSKGATVHGIVIFSMSPGPLAQIASGFIFFQALAQYLVNLNVWAHNLLVLLHRRGRKNIEESPDICHVQSTGDHKARDWFAATAFIAFYSAIIAVAVPFFCTLVGLVTSVTYLTCAYTLPAWFALVLLGDRLGLVERVWLKALIPLSIILSCIGLVASVKTYMVESSGGEGF
ncbi:hypothetical protein HYH03_009942 [Edaphochlamys debaryana]|uniref:Amino acid transporter transmembrane domain-containing protein n=1 Tax=Edaphochlamys debaryana TaxID=47281 RepID=A0A835XY61_9CHLO|nr:hypothetical protein HYH03_009942 [Edaphochlamys debaryana]|eukprot:KAG2491782.1 hypothetical protein HYH03_009942 [Edaphochlamys debaryana]